jgi:CRP/FNR family transcriptional regulator, cyclic AMP receptor protein
MTDPTAAEILRGLPLFRGLGGEALEAVAGRAVWRELPRGTMLFRQDRPCEGLHVVAAGAVRVYRASRDGREQILHVQRSGQALAEVPLFDGGPYPASARAEVDSRVLFLAIDDFRSLYRTDPEIADAVIGELGRRLRQAVRLIEKISLKDVQARVAATLLEYAGREAEVRDGTTFRLGRTQEEMAAELATTRESIARALAKLRRSGAIERDGARIRVLDVAALRHASTSLDGATDGRR